jgi:hypothetical protein
VEKFAGAADLMVESPIPILSGKTDAAVVKKDYVLLRLHTVKGMVAMR